MEMWRKNVLDRNDVLEEVIEVARLMINSPPRSAELVRLLSKLKEKIEELDEKD